MEKNESPEVDGTGNVRLNDGLGVYYAYWDQNGFGFSAVVVAGSETDAIRLLELDESYETLERIQPFGMAFPGETAHVVCRESL